MSIETALPTTAQSPEYWNPGRELTPPEPRVPGEVPKVITEVSMPPVLAPGSSREQALDHAIMLRRGMVALMGAYDANTRVDNLCEVMAAIQEQKQSLPSASVIGILATKFSIKYDNLVGRTHQPRRAQYPH